MFVNAPSEQKCLKRLTPTDGDQDVNEADQDLGEFKTQLTGEKPRVVMFVGLQGLQNYPGWVAKRLRAHGERVAGQADPYRPAAIKQLQTLGQRQCQSIQKMASNHRN